MAKDSVLRACASAYQKIRNLEALSSVKLEANESMNQELFAKNDLVNNLTQELKQLKEEKEALKTKIESQNNDFLAFTFIFTLEIKPCGLGSRTRDVCS